VAVVGAAMELVAEFGAHGNGKEVGWAGLDKPRSPIHRSRRSDFVNHTQAGVVHEFARSYSGRRCPKTCGHIFAGRWMELES